MVLSMHFWKLTCSHLVVTKTSSLTPMLSMLCALSGRTAEQIRLLRSPMQKSLMVSSFCPEDEGQRD